MNTLFFGDKPDKVVHVFETVEIGIDQKIALNIQTGLTTLFNQTGIFLCGIDMAFIIGFKSALLDGFESDKHHYAAGFDKSSDRFFVFKEGNTEKNAEIDIALLDEFKRFP